MYYGKKVRQMYWYPILTCKCNILFGYAVEYASLTLEYKIQNACVVILSKINQANLLLKIFEGNLCPTLYFATDTYCHANWIL